MYFIDFLQKDFNEIAEYKKVYIYGNNAFTIDFATTRMAKAWGRDLIYANKADELEVHNTTLFGNPKAYVLSSSLNPKTIKDYMIKHSKNKIAAKYKKEGFVEICCNNLTVKQAEAFLGHISNIGLPKELIKQLCFVSNYDAYSIWNASLLLDIAYKNNQSLNFEELIFYSGNLSNIETIQAVNYFVKGEFDKFMTYLNTSPSNPRELMWIMSTILNKGTFALNGMYTNAFYYKNIANDLRKFSIDMKKVAIYIYNIAIDFNLSSVAIILKLQHLIFYLKGLSPNL